MRIYGKAYIKHIIIESVCTLHGTVYLISKDCANNRGYVCEF